MIHLFLFCFLIVILNFQPPGVSCSSGDLLILIWGISWRLHEGPVLICNTIVERLIISGWSVTLIIWMISLGSSIASMRDWSCSHTLLFHQKAINVVHPFLVDHRIQEPSNASTSELVTNWNHPWKCFCEASYLTQTLSMSERAVVYEWE